MDLESRFGLMEPNMKDNGIMGKLMAEVNSLMLMVMFMRETGEMTKHLDMEFISIITVQSIKENGSMIISMEKEFNHGLMEVNTRDIMNKAKRMEKVNILGEMAVTSLEIGKIIK